MAKPKRKANLKLNKKPKNKTVDNMKKFLAKRDKIIKENDKRERDYKKDVKEWESLKDKVAAK